MPSETCTDREVDLLLPWLVNDTLAGEERRRVDVHVADCAICQRTVVALRQVSDAIRAEAPIPGRDLYARMRSQMPSLPSEPRGLFPRIFSPVPVYARIIIAAQFIALLVLAGLLLSRSPVLTTLSYVPATGPAVRLQVIFNSQVSSGQVQALLASMSARIVDGPSPTGVYVVEVPLGSDYPDSTSQAALDLLQKSPLIVFATIVEERR
jgi:hypothetical protein